MIEGIDLELNAMINQHYDQIIPHTEDAELKQILDQIKIIIAYHDGLISSLPKLASDKLEVPFYPFLAKSYGKNLGLKWCQRLKHKLSILKRYRITNPEQIRRIIWTSFEGQATVKPKDVENLKLFFKNPGLRLNKISQMTNIPYSTLADAKNKLKQSIGLRVLSDTNYAKFKLNHFTIFAEAPRAITRDELIQLFNTPFTRSINTHLYGIGRESRPIWASFLIPNQRRILRDFKDGVAGLKSILTNTRYYKTLEVIRGTNFNLYHDGDWYFPEDIFSYGLLQFTEDNLEILPTPPVIRYIGNPIQFDRIDFLITIYYSANIEVKQKTIQDFLKEEYEIEISLASISNRLKRLRSNDVFHPSVAYNGLGIPNLAVFVVSCEDEIYRLISKFVPQLPRHYLYRTDQGFILALYLPDKSISKFVFLFEGLRDKVVSLQSYHQYEGAGTRWLFEAEAYWNEKRQYWTCPKEMFDFTEKIELT